MLHATSKATNLQILQDEVAVMEVSEHRRTPTESRNMWTPNVAEGRVAEEDPAIKELEENEASKIQGKYQSLENACEERETRHGGRARAARDCEVQSTAVPVIVPTVAEAFGVVEPQLPEIAKCSATTVFERTGFNSVLLLLSMTVVPIPGECAKTVRD